MTVSRRDWLGWTQARELIGQELARRGFASATAYADASPDLCLEELAERLGLEGVHDGHLHLKLWEEAAATGTTERCARDLLARELRRHLPGGWSKKLDTPQASIFYIWENTLPLNYQPAAKTIYQMLKDCVPEGWRPAGAHDPILVEVYGNCWPVEPHTTRGHLSLTEAGDIAIEYTRK